MLRFFVTYKPKNKAITKTHLTATTLDKALKQIGYPDCSIFSFYHYLSPDDIDAAVAKAPTKDILRFEDWEKRFGRADDPKYFWVEIKTDTPHRQHRLTNGRYTLRLCLRTGHVRFPSIGEYYDNWLSPQDTQSALS